MIAEVDRVPRAGARRRVRRLHGRARRPRARAARRRGGAGDRPRPRPRGARRGGRRAGAVGRARRARARRLPQPGRRCSTRGASRRWTACSPISACRRCSSRARAGASAFSATSRSTCGWTAARDRPRRIWSRRRDEVGAGRRHLPLRRGAVLAPDRARHRGGAGREPIATTGRAGRDRAAGGPAARSLADRSGDADVSGAADLGEPRARRARRVPDRGGAAARAPGAGWSSSRFTRSRIGSSSTRSAPGRRTRRWR